MHAFNHMPFTANNVFLEVIYIELFNCLLKSESQCLLLCFDKHIFALTLKLTVVY